ncbi:uncharacterized protein [Typha angustifolia]|uniref:uncharacterized protein n=1 Tax=Typha angustifolia TaxID=59011 RepID=UPI003C306702
MGSSMNSSNLSILQHLSNKTSISNSSKLFRITCKRHAATCWAYTNQSKQESIARTSPADYNVEFQTLESCKLGISRYPDFEYNAKGGLGSGTGRKEEGAETDDVVLVAFDFATLYIPPLTAATTKFLGLPLPPFLKIDIVPEFLQGSINRTSGKVDLQFRSKFWFSIGSIYKAPPLVVETTLTSEQSKGTTRSGSGQRMDEQGRCKLVGVAVVDPISDILMNSFLGLPTECIAYLNAKISLAPV